MSQEIIKPFGDIECKCDVPGCINDIYWDGADGHCDFAGLKDEMRTRDWVTIKRGDSWLHICGCCIDSLLYPGGK